MRKMRKKIVASIVLMTLCVVFVSGCSSRTKNNAEMDSALKGGAETVMEVQKMADVHFLNDVSINSIQAGLLALQNAEVSSEAVSVEQTGIVSDAVAGENTNGYWTDTSATNTAYYSNGGFGSAGRLEIPALGISVALHDVWNDGSDSQAVVDMWDAAAWMPSYSSVLIADHCDQAFASLPGSYVGMTGYINYPGSSSMITCVDTAYGDMNGSLYINGELWCNRYPYCLVMYTCTYDWQHVFVSVWQWGSGTGTIWPSEGYAPVDNSDGQSNNVEFVEPAPYETPTLPPNDGVIILD